MNATDEATFYYTTLRFFLYIRQVDVVVTRHNFTLVCDDDDTVTIDIESRSGGRVGVVVFLFWVITFFIVLE